MGKTLWGRYKNGRDLRNITIPKIIIFGNVISILTRDGQKPPRIDISMITGSI